jgi:hypothetical protein
MTIRARDVIAAEHAYARNEPKRSLHESEAFAFLAVAKQCSVNMARKIIRRRFGRGSRVLAEFDRLLAHRAPRKREHQLCDADRSRILELSREGWVASRIASYLRLRHWRVTGVLRQARNDCAVREDLTQGVTREVLAALERGDQTIREIADSLKVRPQSVMRIARNNRSRLMFK